MSPVRDCAGAESADQTHDEQQSARAETRDEPVAPIQQHGRKPPREAEHGEQAAERCKPD